ncbi:hypothetical protein KKG24_02710 [Patescibacteria group bacterium]|nr:hypothetical protein [Patescibacteria group bacterium]
MSKKFYETKYDSKPESDKQQASLETEYQTNKLEDFQNDIKQKFADIDWKILAVIVILLVMVAGIIVDTIIFHIESNRWQFQIEEMLINQVKQSK